MREQFENEEDYSENDLSATELTAGDNDDSLVDDDESDTDYEDDTDLKDDELIFNDDDNEEYADGRPNNAGSGTGDNMDDGLEF